MVEEWRSIPGFEGLYEASSLGRLRSVPRRAVRYRGTPGVILKSSPNPRDYLTIGLRRDGRKFTRRVHSLVALAFHGPRPPGQEVRHLDGDHRNNAASNLAYGTKRENDLDKVRHRGEETHCPNGHKWTPETIYIRSDGAKRCRECEREREKQRGPRQPSLHREVQSRAA